MKELYDALCKFQAETKIVNTDKNNPFFNSEYATLAAYISEAQPILFKNGLSVSQVIERSENTWVLCTILAHTSGHELKSHCPIIATKQDAQGFGSSITYARRYSYAAILGLTSKEEDDDGNASKLKERKEFKAPSNKTHSNAVGIPNPFDPLKDVKEHFKRRLGADITEDQIAWLEKTVGITRDKWAQKSVIRIKAIINKKAEKKNDHNPNQ